MGEEEEEERQTLRSFVFVRTVVVKHLLLPKHLQGGDLGDVVLLLQRGLRAGVHSRQPHSPGS